VAGEEKGREHHMEDDERTSRGLLELDARRRVSLGAIASYDRYLVDVEDDGTIVLTPAVVMSAAEARLRAAPETARRIDEFLDNPEVGSRRIRPVRPMQQRRTPSQRGVATP
jgi:hypothetical protein